MKIINYFRLGLKVINGLISGEIDEDAVRKIIDRELPFFSRHSLKFIYGTKETMIEGFKLRSNDTLDWDKRFLEKVIVESCPGEIFESNQVYLLEDFGKKSQPEFKDARREINKWNCIPGGFGLTMAFARNNPQMDKWIYAIGSITRTIDDVVIKEDLMLGVNPYQKKIGVRMVWPDDNGGNWVGAGDVFIAYRID